MHVAGAPEARPIYYLGHANDPSVTDESRIVSLAATTKMEYIADVINRLGYQVDFISMAGPAEGSAGAGGTFTLKKGQSLTLWPVRPKGSKMNGLVNYVKLRRRTKAFLSALHPEDTVLCYHSLEFCSLLAQAKRRTGFRLILEVEELYSDVTGKPSDLEREMRSFAAADAFVFPTKLLADRVGAGSRPYVICSGIYRLAEKVAERRSDGATHVVYAGTLDPRKGGAAAAAAAGAFLDADYAVHILGGGCSEAVAAIEKAVESSNAVSRGCRTTYEGQKSGKEFDAFVQSCHIGLSPQNPDADFNESSFPSKVFMYLSNGLDVVSVDLPVFEGRLREALTLCPDNKPETLADTIASASRDGGSSSAHLLAELDAKLTRDLDELLSIMHRRP